MSQQSITAADIAKEQKKQKHENKLTIMVIVLSVFSIILHIMLILVIIGTFLLTSLQFAYLFAFYVFLAGLKHSTNFFIFFYFDKNFKKYCMAKFRNVHHQSSSTNELHHVTATTN